MNNWSKNWWNCPVLFEIKRGLRPPDRKKILPLFDALIRLSVDESIWDAAGDLYASLRKKGITIPPMDAIIAQVCRHHKVSLFTLDEHFYSIPGLKFFELRDYFSRCIHNYLNFL